MTSPSGPAKPIGDAESRFFAADAILLDAERVLAPGFIEVMEGRIHSIGAGNPPKDSRTIACAPNHLIVPGFVNAHAHLSFGLSPLLGHDLSFFEWMNEGVLPEVQAAAKDPTRFERGAQRSVSALAQSGVTFIAESFFTPVGALAIQSFGLKGAFFQEVFGFAVADDAAYLAREEADWQSLSETSEGLFAGFAPHTPWSCPPRVFAEVARRARQQGLLITTHLSESPEEELLFREGRGPLMELRKRMPNPERWPTGLSPTEHLSDLGVLGPDLVIAHGVQLTPSDLDLLAENAVGVVHCPTSNARLSEGVAPVAEMLERGMRVALGTDSVASTGRLDFFQEMRQFILGQRARRRFVSAREAFDAATRVGAELVGQGAQRGRLDVGFAADFVVVDLSAEPEAFASDPLAAVVWCASPKEVREVWVAGNRVLPRA